MTRLPRRPRLSLPAALLILVLVPLPAWPQEKPLRQVIDDHVRAAWQREKVTPAGRADDAAFLRRVTLDLAGTIPTHDEVRQFLSDTDPKKREKWIDRLLDDPRCAAQQAAVWDLVFFGRNPPDPDVTQRREVFRKWLTEQFAKNAPYGRWVSELLLGEGNIQEKGPPMFYVQFRSRPEEMAVAVSRIFLGTQLQCARCHDHPFDRWKQLDFYGLAGFFARLTFIEASAAGRRSYLVAEKSTGEVMFSGPAAEQKPGQKGTPVPPRFLGGAVLEEPPLPAGFKEPDLKGIKAPPKPVFSRVEKLAGWVTEPRNPYFARAAVNRVWAQFLGRGLVHPVDDLGEANQPSHPELLDALAERFRAQQFDLKGLIRELVNSDAYQLAGGGDSKDALPRWFERARVRPLSAEEIVAAMRMATGYDTAQKDAKLPSGAEEYFRRYFGEPANGRGDFQASLQEHLFVNNSGQVRQMIQPRKGNLADALLTSKVSSEEKVDRLFVTVLGRPPRPEEQKRFVAHLTSAGKPEALVEEAIWVLLSSSEFRFNH